MNAEWFLQVAQQLSVVQVPLTDDTSIGWASDKNGVFEVTCDLIHW